MSPKEIWLRAVDLYCEDHDKAVCQLTADDMEAIDAEAASMAGQSIDRVYETLRDDARVMEAANKLRTGRF